MLIFNICVCVIFCFAAVFLIGKKLGEAPIFKMEKAIKEQEQKINNMIHGFDDIVNCYMTEFAKRETQLKELLIVIDQKCVYINDILEDAERECDDLKKAGFSSTVSHSQRDNLLKLKNEVKGTVDEIYEKVESLRKEQNSIKNSLERLDSQCSGFDKQIERSKKVHNLSEDEVIEIASREVGVLLDALNTDIIEEAEKNIQTEDAEIFEPSAKSKALLPASIAVTSKETDNLPDVSEKAVTSKASPAQVVSDSADSAVFIPEGLDTIFETISQDDETEDENKFEVIKPAPGAVLPSEILKENAEEKRNHEIIHKIVSRNIGYPREDVFRMYKQGIAVPQIARQLHIGIGEVELMLQIYRMKNGSDKS